MAAPASQSRPRRFQLDTRRRELLREGEVRHLPPKAFAVLELLVARAGEIVTRSELVELAWGGMAISADAVRYTLRQVRIALDDPVDAPDFIETVTRRGWRFVGRVMRAEADVCWLTPAEAASSRAARPVLVGRARDFAVLEDAMREVRSGRAQVVYVIGEPGIGKTSLVEEFVGLACERDGALCARGECIEYHGAGQPYMPLLEAVERAASGFGGDLPTAILRRAGGLSVDGTLRLESDAVLTHAAGDEACLVVTATRLEIDSTSAIDVTARGYSGGIGGDDPGETLDGQIGSAVRDGGSYGGRGGDDPSFGAEPGPVYGDPRRPMLLGSGGGAATSGSHVAGFGGGCIRVSTSEALVVDGALRANGGLPTGSSQIGMGSGGSIWIDTQSLGGLGVIEANGGNRNGVDHAGGGGGRIALYYDVLDPLADPVALRNVTAFGGDGFYADGASGTIYLEQTAQIDGTLISDAGRTADTWSPEAQLPEVGPGAAAAVTADTLTLDGGRVLLPGGLVGLRLNPDASQSETFAIAANTGSTITVVTPNENAVAFSSVAAVGATYTGDWRFDEVVLRGGVIQQFADPVAVNGAFDVSERSVLTHPLTTSAPSYEPDLVVVAGSMGIDASSAVDVSARGYEGGTTDLSGFGEGNVRTGGGTRDGGSHGGLGGDDVSFAGTPPPTYGSDTDPRTLGAGGSGPTFGSRVGGAGGGRALLTILGDLTIDGEVVADGGVASGSGQVGMGAGGSLNLSSDRLLGTGIVRAGGGNRNGTTNAGGGGGRIAISTTTANALPSANVSAPAGDGFYADGEPGTVVIVGP